MKKSLFLSIFFIAIASLAFSQVVVNEFIVTPTGGEELELYNKGASSEDISGWTLEVGASVATFQAGTSIAAGAYLAISDGSSEIDAWPGLPNGGQVIVLKDDSASVIDQVAYGDEGGCPAPQYNHSVERAPNGADSDDDAADWNYQENPTLGSANTAPAAALGSGDVYFNEIWTDPATESDSFIELYNGGSSSVDLSGWKIIAGSVYEIPGGTSIAAGDFWVLNSADYPSYFGYDGGASMTLYYGENLYLLNGSGARVDQLQVDSNADSTESIGCYPDGDRSVFDSYQHDTIIATDFGPMTPSNGSANNVAGVGDWELY